MDWLILSLRLRKQVTDLFSEIFQLFSYVEIDREYSRYILFTRSLISICVDSLETIINNYNTIDFYGIFLMQ